MKMEKYYLANLLITSGANVDLRRRVKLVEVHYTRRPPSFGLVYFNNSSDGADTQRRTIQLASLELSDNNVARFSVSRRVDFNRKEQSSSTRWSLVDFDTSKAVMLEAGIGGAHCHCVALTPDGDLFNVGLVDGSVKRITSSCHFLPMDGQFIQCQLQPRLGFGADGGVDDYEPTYVHLVAEKSYSLHKLEENSSKLQLIHKYSLLNEERSFAQLNHLHVMQSNPEVVIVELQDKSLRLLQQGQCLTSFNLSDQLGPNQRHLIAGGSSAEEATLLSYGRSFIVAHSLLVSSKESKGSVRPTQDPATSDDNDRDPDKLLPKEPSFEVDECWSIDLNDIESVRSLDEDDDMVTEVKYRGCICPMWSSAQLNPDGSMAKFLVVAYKYHLLIYSFEHQPSLPFSVVYDKSFLKIEPLEGVGPKGGQPRPSSPIDFTDPSVRPRLIHNFKLIGAHPSDALFNGIFLVPNAHLIQCHHFSQLGILVAMTSSGDLLAFKCVSPQVAPQRQSLYQQLVADSLRGSSLLTTQIELMQHGNNELEERLNSFALLTSKQSQQQHLDRFLKTELTYSNQIGCLYKLNMQLSNRIQVAKVIIVSTFDLFMLKPTSEFIESAHIENGMTRDNKPGPILLSNIDFRKLKVSHEELLSGQEGDEEAIHNFAILDLQPGAQEGEIDLPVYILDGQSGQLRVHYVLRRPKDDSLRSFESPLFADILRENKEELHDETIFRYHSTTLPVKKLMSYKPCSDSTSGGFSDLQLSYKLTGAFSLGRIVQWLSECFNHDTTQDFPIRYKSNFTHCTIECSIEESQATITSDDLIALELIKKHLLKCATDESTKLDISHTPPTLRHLRHLIGLLYTNLLMANNMSSGSEASSGNDQRNREEVDSWLLDCLTSEMSLCDFPLDLQPALVGLEDSMKQDIRSLKKSSSVPDRVKQNDSDDQENQQSELEIFNDIIFGFIIDALIDFDKLLGLKGASSDSVALMREKFIETLSVVRLERLDKSSFCDTVLNNWNAIKRNITSS